uniref:Fibronectin type-III domain-containing protein n=1 Tax=Globodera pallida TaxID=36090 RepID=A0A183BIW6_GLOPA
MISTAPPSSTSTTGALMANKKATRTAQSIGTTTTKKLLVMKANGRHQQQQQQTPPVGGVGTEVDRLPSMDTAGPIPLRRVSHAFDQQHHHHQGAKTLSAPPGYQHQIGEGVFNHPLNTTTPTSGVVSHNVDSSDCGSSSGLGGMGTPIKGEEGCFASCSTSSNNSMAADCSLDSRDSGGHIPRELAGAEDGGQPMGNGHRLLLATATLTPSMVSSSHHSSTISPESASMGPIFPPLAVPQQQMLQQPQQQPFSAFAPPIPLLQLNASQINALRCAASGGSPPLMPPLPAAAGAVPYAAIENTSRTSSALAAVGGTPSPGTLMSKTGLKQLHPPLPPPPLSGRALYTMTCETTALASVSAAALTAGYHVTLDPSAFAPPIIATATPPVGAEFQQAAVPTCENDSQTQKHNDASPRDQKNENGNSTMNGPSDGNRSMGNGSTVTGGTTVNLPPGVPQEIAAAISEGNDLFVHIHPGDAIALAVGNDIQHIHGPATIRMVSQSATPQSAIPMNVPEGHVVQQILDRQGRLSHIIMSQERVLPAGIGPIVGQHAVATTTVSQASAVALPPTTSLAMQQRSIGYQPHPSTATVPLKHFRSNNNNSHSPQHPLDASPLSDGVPPSSRQKQQAQEHGNDLQQHQHSPHQQPPQHQSQSGGPYGKHQQQGRALASSSSGGYHLTDSVVSAHLQQRHSPGFYVQGSAMVGMENRGHDTATNVVYPRQQQQQSVHNAADAFNAVNLPPQITAMIEDDEKDRLRDTLSSLQPPILSRVGDCDAEVLWQEIDTSEAAASGGPFPQIDPSEFNYQLTLYDAASHSQTFYKTEAGVNMLHLQQLSPGTEYMVAVRAELAERGDINGQLSAYTSFRTLCALPEAPSLPKLVGRQSNVTASKWRGGKMAPFETVYDGPHEQTVISSSDGNALCRFRVFARNEIGQSGSSPVLTVHPERGDVSGRPHHHQHVQQHHQQQQHGGMAQRGSLMGSSVSPSVLGHYHQTQPILRPPHPPNVYSTAPRAIKLSWNSSSGADFSSLVLEMADLANARGSTHFAAVPPECYANSGTFAHITGLLINREYRFRLAATTPAGDVLYSDPIAVRTRHEQTSSSMYKERRELEGGHHHQYTQHHHDNNKMARTSILGHDSVDHHHHQQQHQPVQPPPPHHIKKPAVPPNQMSLSPSQNLPSKKQHKNTHQKQFESQQSAEEQSEDTTTPVALLQPSPKAPNCSAPAFSALTNESARVGWKLVKSSAIGGDGFKGTANDGGDTNKTTLSSALIFELQRVDRQQPMMVYSGVDSDFDYKGLRPVEHMQLRVRAVLLDTEGRRLEGEWSPVGSTCTLCAPPSAPQNLRLAVSATEETLASGESTGKGTAIVSNDDDQWHSIGICWNIPAQLNGATISEYSIHTQRFDLSYAVTKPDAVEEKPLEEQTQHISAANCHFNFQRLRPAHLYRFTVTAQSDAGPSPKSEVLEYRSPPGVPAKPRDVRVDLSWSEPSSTNGSPIVSYHVYCFKLCNARYQQDSSATSALSGSKRQLVSQQIAPSSQRLLIIQSLEAETEYELSIQAENSVGKSGREIVQHKTLVEPPEPPQIFLAQATANSLKLKWSVDGDSNLSGANHYYYLERENENGTYSPVYEGELRTARVKGLREQSFHHFRIRASVSKGLLLGPIGSLSKPRNCHHRHLNRPRPLSNSLRTISNLNGIPFASATKTVAATSRQWTENSSSNNSKGANSSTACRWHPNWALL